MADDTPLVIDSIRSLEVTPDGQYFIVAGNAGTIALRRSLLDNLLVALPHAIEMADRVADGDAQKRFALHCEGWEVGRLNGTENLVVRFQLHGNAGISFSVPCEQVPYIVHALCAAAGLPSPVRDVAVDSGVTLQ